MAVMLDRIRVWLERIDITPIQWLAAFVCIVIGRLFLEAFSNPTSSGVIASDAPTLVHEILFFAVMALAAMLILQWAVPSWKRAIPALALFSFSWIYAAPIIDLLVTGGRGSPMNYIFIDSSGRWLYSLATFFWSYPGVTIGMHLEIIVAIIAVGVFVYVVRRSLLRAMAASIALYIAVFVAGSLPGILDIVPSITHAATLPDNIHGTLRYASFQRLIEIGFDFMMARIWLVAFLVLVWTWFMTNLKIQTIAIFKNTRPERAVRYMLLVGAGVLIAYHQSRFSMNWNDWMALATLLLAYYLSWMHAICVNDAFDVDIDAVSNRERPIQNGKISIGDAKAAGYVFLIAALVAGYVSGYYAFFCVLFANAFAHIYSVPPLRLKRFPLTAALIVALYSLSAVMAGFFTFSSSKEVSAFSPWLAVGIVAVFFLAEHMKDIKDIEGDKSAGIMTIPTMLGPIWGVRAVGMFAAAAYLLVPFVAGDMFLLYGAVPAAIVNYLFVTKRPYSERPIFVVGGLFVLFLIAVLIPRL